MPAVKKDSEKPKLTQEEANELNRILKEQLEIIDGREVHEGKDKKDHESKKLREKIKVEGAEKVREDKNKFREIRAAAKINELQPLKVHELRQKSEYEKTMREALNQEQIAKDYLELLKKADKELRGSGNISTKELSKFAANARKSLLANMEALGKLKDKAKAGAESMGAARIIGAEIDKGYKEQLKEQLAQQIAHHLKMIDTQLESLEIISRMTAYKFTVSPLNLLQNHDSDYLGDLRANLSDPDTGSFKILFDKFEEFWKDIKELGENLRAIFSTSKSVAPMGMHELLNIDVRNRYADSEKYTEQDAWGKAALFAHKYSRNAARDKQLEVLDKIMILFREKQKNKDLDKDDLLILKGCFLAFKHQVDNEKNVFKSRLGNSLDDMLETPELKGLSAKTAIQKFGEFAGRDPKALKIDPAFEEKIRSAIVDKAWVEAHEPKAAVKKDGPM